MQYNKIISRYVSFGRAHVKPVCIHMTHQSWGCSSAPSSACLTSTRPWVRSQKLVRDIHAHGSSNSCVLLLGTRDAALSEVVPEVDRMLSFARCDDLNFQNIHESFRIDYLLDSEPCHSFS
jgi:hypothetical protein